LRDSDKWLCDMALSCELRGSDVCGHGLKGPLIKSYHPKEGQRPECYISHVLSCLQEWNRMERRYVKSLTRILSTSLTVSLQPEEVKTIMRLLVASHDIGKLTWEYQEGQRWFRHELLGACCVYEFSSTSFNRSSMLLAFMASAVYLHHEAIQLRRGLRTPYYEYLLHLLHGKTFTFVSGYEEIIEYLNKISEVDIQIPPQVLDANSVLKTLATIIATVDGNPRAPIFRLAVAGLLQPLTLVDYVAASKRGGRTTRFAEFVKKAVFPEVSE